MKRTTLILVVVGLLLIGGTGFFAYTRGVEAGRAQANDIRNEFFRSRGIAGGFGGASGSQGAAATTNEPAAGGARGGAGAAASPAAGRGGGNGGAAAVFGGAPVTVGRIQQITDDTIVLTSRDDSSVTVKLADATTIMRQARAERSALKDGMSVTVIGEAGTDGTIAARSVTILGIPGAETSQAQAAADETQVAGTAPSR